jgi:hypothetical protein
LRSQSHSGSWEKRGLVLLAGRLVRSVCWAMQSENLTKGPEWARGLPTWLERAMFYLFFSMEEWSAKEYLCLAVTLMDLKGEVLPGAWAGLSLKLSSGTIGRVPCRVACRNI